MNRRAAFQIVDTFEEALCEYTGSSYAVAVDSCTNALHLALLYEFRLGVGDKPTVSLPAHNYVGVYHAARNAGWNVEWVDVRWEGHYTIPPTRVVDAAKDFHGGCYQPGSLYCVSFQAAKRLPIGRGGAILHDNPAFDTWARRARFDGRGEGEDYKNPTFTQPGFHCYLTPDAAARGLWLLTYLEDDDQGNWTEYPNLREFL